MRRGGAARYSVRTGFCRCALLLVLIFTSGLLLCAQQQPARPAQDDYEELEKFLPIHSEADEDAQILLMIQCTTCHSAKATKERIGQRAGGDLTFWTTLVSRMNTSWNASIPDEDLTVIVSYLAR